jgi:hypothetical protein
MFHDRRQGLAGLLILGAAALAHGWTEPVFSPGQQVGVLDIPRLKEASGLAASRSSDQVLWVHNDSGSAGELLAISTTGKLLGSYVLPGVTPVDCEDLAIGPGPTAGLDYLYLGDIGDNDSQRKKVIVYRLPEPAVYQTQAARPVRRQLQGVQALSLVYPDGPHNAETLLVDPQSGQLLIGTKQDKVTRFYAASREALAGTAEIKLALVAEVAFHLASAGDVSATGDQVLLRREEFAQLWRRAPGQSLAEAFRGLPVKVPVIGPPTEPNGEAVALDPLGSGYYTTSEEVRQGLYYFARVSADRPAVPRPLVTAGAAWKYLDDGSDQGLAWRQPDYDDSGWQSGPAPLGYGDGDEATVVQFGGDPRRRHLTTYFRRTFQLEAAPPAGKLLLRLVYDDGAAVFLNGQELQRVNLADSASAATPAQRSPAETEEAWFTWPVDSAALQVGENILAAEVHQRSADSSDLSFDLQLLWVPR